MEAGKPVGRALELQHRLLDQVTTIFINFPECKVSMGYSNNTVVGHFVVGRLKITSPERERTKTKDETCCKPGREKKWCRTVGPRSGSSQTLGALWLHLSENGGFVEVRLNPISACVLPPIGVARLWMLVSGINVVALGT